MNALWRRGVALSNAEERRPAVVAPRKVTDLQPRPPEAKLRWSYWLNKLGHRPKPLPVIARLYRQVVAELRLLAEARALLVEGKDEEAGAEVAPCGRRNRRNAAALPGRQVDALEPRPGGGLRRSRATLLNLDAAQGIRRTHPVRRWGKISDDVDLR